MTIPFLNLFKNIQKSRVKTVAKAPLRIEKPSNERMSKTVMPNSTRTVSSQDPFPLALDSSILSVADSTRDGRRMVSYTPNSSVPVMRPRDLPPAVALALEPDVERVITLELGDIIGQIPAGYLKPAASFDVKRTVLLKAAEVEKGMATGQPSVSLPSIYQQVPEIFLHTVPETEKAPVALPFEKVLAGFQNLRIRSDQEHDPAVPQVETPFLKATLQDSETFGVPFEPLQACETPPVRLELATAQSLAAAEPEASDRFIPTVAPPRAPLNIPPVEESCESGFAPAKNGAPLTIPFHLPPNGTGAPASERVPASSGRPVPTSLPSQNGPTRIPFKVRAPSDALRRRKPKPPADADWIVTANDLLAAGGSAEMETGGSPEMETKGSPAIEIEPAKIKLGLKAILQALPAFQLNGDAKEVPEEVRIEFPFSLIESQLATGRVGLSPKVFEEILPQGYRHLFNASEPNALVSLPLEEVLKNLPGTSLRIRDDQEEHDVGANFKTPFSVKAAEDAKRLQIESGPIVKKSSVTAPKTEVSLGTAAVTEEKFDAKSAVAKVMQLPGVSACAVTFADGLSLAGNLPEDLGAEGLCAMAPSLLHRIGDYMTDTKLGGLNAMTLHCANAPLTFFMHGNICLSALHSAQGLTAEIREQLGRIAQELSQMYSQPEVSHVDH
jgi:predicted regulator of Ras-like GTPase activity (Roadblock/LC7/MglB family)